VLSRTTHAVNSKTIQACFMGTPGVQRWVGHHASHGPGASNGSFPAMQGGRRQGRHRAR
jgi:hypothetical protein